MKLQKQKMKKMYNDAIGFGKMPAFVHVDEHELVDDFNNMLLREALVLTQVLYGIDISENSNQGKNYYTDLINQVYITVYQFYEQLFSLLSVK